jgi:CDP-paratose 2-epimerase
MRVVVTGGAGFIGANLSVALASRHNDWEIVAFDNLKRRGSELNVRRLREAGVEFVHGDVRVHSDLLDLEPVQAIVECSAEPSVMAGTGGSPDYVVQSNLFGAYHCLELARRDQAQFIFLSTSRVYPVLQQDQLAYEEAETRFELTPEQPFTGASGAGISEEFPLDGARTLYGATKLSAELLTAEYAALYGLRVTVNRFGVVAGPWQMGKIDQGVFTHWMLSFYFKLPLAYFGYGGTGKQVRDLVHVDDLVDLVDEQLFNPGYWAGCTFNVGGGRAGSLSLRETTDVCRELTGNEMQVGSVNENRPSDVRIYLSDCSALFTHTDWRPKRTPREALQDIYSWIGANERTLRGTIA